MIRSEKAHYGRAFPAIFAAEVERHRDMEWLRQLEPPSRINLEKLRLAQYIKPFLNYRPEWPSGVYRDAYLRGVDGFLAEKPASAGMNAGAPATGDSELTSNRPLERPEGASQLDYIRRLAERLKQIDRRARLQGKRGIRL